MALKIIKASAVVQERKEKPPDEIVFWIVGDNEKRHENKKAALTKARAVIAQQSGYPVIFVYEFKIIQLTEEKRMDKKMTTSEFYLEDCIEIQKERTL